MSNQGMMGRGEPIFSGEGAVITSTPSRFSPLLRHGGRWRVVRGVGGNRGTERVREVVGRERRMEGVATG